MIKRINRKWKKAKYQKYSSIRLLELWFTKREQLAITILVERYQVMGILKFLELCDYDINKAEDAVQAVFIRITQNQKILTKKFPTEQNFKNFLLISFKNEILSNLRKAKSLNGMKKNFANSEMRSYGTIQNEYENQAANRSKKVVEILSYITEPDNRKIFELYLEGVPYREIGKVLDYTFNEVQIRGRITRTRAMLKTKHGDLLRKIINESA